LFTFACDDDIVLVDNFSIVSHKDCCAYVITELQELDQGSIVMLILGFTCAVFRFLLLQLFWLAGTGVLWTLFVDLSDDNIPEIVSSFCFCAQSNQLHNVAHCLPFL